MDEEKGIVKRAAALVRPLGAPATRRIAAIVLAVLAGGWIGLLLGGNVSSEVGPVKATFSVRPWPTGDTSVTVAPLGSVTFDTHDGPMRVSASVDRIRPQAAQRIVTNPKSLTGMGDRVASDLRDALVWLAIKATLSATAGASIFALVVYRRRWKLVTASGIAAAVFMASTGVTGYLTFDPQSIAEPRYTGLLTSAPRIVGNVENLTQNFAQYRQELAKLITNVSQIYSATSGLNPYEADQSTIRVLHVSDLHLNPASWSLIQSVAKQFKVNLIVDSGDIVDNGSTVENRYVRQISSLDVPYVYVRGNHDSRNTLEAVANEPNSVVLTGTTKTVKGLRIFGAGDPRFTPDQNTRDQPGRESLRAVGLQLAEQLRTAKPPADIAVIHDPVEAKALDGTVPLILSGHVHDRSTKVLPNGSRLMVEGSTGGAGVRALDGDQPMPIQMSVLYIDKKTQRVQAWDGITIGGLGLSSAQITRHVVDNPGRELQPPTSQSPTPAQTSPTSSGG